MADLQRGTWLCHLCRKRVKGSYKVHLDQHDRNSELKKRRTKR